MQENSNSSFNIHYEPSKRTKFLLVVLLLILNIIIRIPSIPHEKGYDSFFIHLLANSLSTFGTAKWWLNWLSVFGLYPDSYASAVPFALSGISQVTGIEMEKAILLFCVIIGLFGTCTAYIFAGRIRNEFIFKYLMSLFFSLAPGFMLFTTWEVSTRGQFVVFLPLFIYMLLNENFKIKKYFLMSICFIFIFSTHHYAYFLVPIAITYISLKIIRKLKPIIFENPYTNYVLILIFIVALVYPFFGGMFIESGSRYTWILDAVVTNIRQIGPLALFLPGGLAYLFIKKKSFESMVMCLTTISLAPIFYSQIYGPFILIFICVFLVSIAFNNLLRFYTDHSHKLITFGIIALIVCFVSFSGFYNHYRTGESNSFWYMGEDTYTSGKWAKNYIPGDAHGLDTGFETSRFFAVSEGHPIVFSEDPVNLAYGWINESDIVCINNSVLSLGYYFEGPYSQKGNALSGQIEWLRTYGQKNDLTNFDYFIEDKYETKPIFRYVESDSNLICDGPRIAIWKNTNKGSTE